MAGRVTRAAGCESCDRSIPGKGQGQREVGHGTQRTRLRQEWHVTTQVRTEAPAKAHLDGPSASCGVVINQEQEEISGFGKHVCALNFTLFQQQEKHLCFRHIWQLWLLVSRCVGTHLRQEISGGEIGRAHV